MCKKNIDPGHLILHLGRLLISGQSSYFNQEKWFKTFLTGQ